MALVVFVPGDSHRDDAMALIASGMPQGEQTIELPVTSSCAEVDDRLRGGGGILRTIVLCVLNFPFLDHGVAGVMWQAATVLSRHLTMVEAPTLRGATGGNPTVLELGCGSAALGAMSGAALGWNAIATDLGDVLKLTKKTVRRNKEELESNGGSLKTVPLIWGHELQQNVNQDFDLIVGSDILYRNELHPALLATLSSIAGPSTRVILSFQVRHPEEEADFLDRGAVVHGFVAEELDIRGLQVSEWHLKFIRLVQLRRK
jgi:predicted nicotinamide N-methyase